MTSAAARILTCQPGPEEPRPPAILAARNVHIAPMALAQRAAYVAGQAHWLAGKRKGWLNAFRSAELSRAFAEGWQDEEIACIDASHAIARGVHR